MRTCFTGYYGMHNFGDDLFGQICSAAAGVYWNSEVMLAGPAITGVDAPAYTMPRWFPSGIYGATGALGKASRLYSFARALRGADVLVMGGGSVIGGRESFRKPMMLSAQRRGRVALAAVGVSIGPFGDAASEASAAALVERFAYVSVRDRRSYELGQRMGLGDRLHLGRDLAGLLPLLSPLAPPAPTMPDGGIRIGIAPCNYAEGRGYAVPDRQALPSTLAAALADLARERRLEVEIYSLNEHERHGDLRGSLELQAQLQQQHGIAARLLRYRDLSPVAMAQAIGGCHAFVSARLHGAIVAYLQGVPMTIIDYHPKCNDFADDIGLGPARRISARRQGVDAAVGSLRAMLDGTDAPTFPRERYAQQAQDIFRCAPWSQAAQAA